MYHHLRTKRHHGRAAFAKAVLQNNWAACDTCSHLCQCRSRQGRVRPTTTARFRDSRCRDHSNAPSATDATWRVEA